MNNSELRISLGQHSDSGIKPRNQDFHGICVPDKHQLASKGIALAIADGISSSEVSHIASESAVSGFLSDYYATTDTWSVKTAVERVLGATNAWLYAQTRQNRYEESDQGYVCTFTALVLKATTAHIFHIGDSRIYRLSQHKVEQLTEDHRVNISSNKSYLARALGISHRLDMDYEHCALTCGDIFVLTTDGVSEFIDIRTFADRLMVSDCNLETIARDMVNAALNNGSDDNLTVQIVRIDQLPALESAEITRQLDMLGCPPPLESGMWLDGLKILRSLKIGSRSHQFLAENPDTGSLVVIKAPSLGMRDDRAYLERFLIEDWITQRLDHAHIVKHHVPPKPRSAIYVATEYIDGQNLAQWLHDNPRPELSIVRSFMKQIARGLQVLHRQEMLHQDLKPDNLMIDRNGTLKLIDFGATRVAGLIEADADAIQINLLGAAQYAAPEYFLGESGSVRSDLYSLGVVAYQMLGGSLPYGDAVPKVRTKRAMQSLRQRYTPLTQLNDSVPVWMDAAIQRAVDPDPELRHSQISEFIHELSQPNPNYLTRKAVPLLQRNPLRFWQFSTIILSVLVVGLFLKMGMSR